MNELKHVNEFRAVLANYQPSDRAKDILRRTKLALLVGPTSSGKNTIIGELLQTGDYHYIVSDTTRKPRANNGVVEQNGREYWFRTEEELLAELEAGNFLEAAVIHNQQVSGVSMRELEGASKEGKIAINEVEVVGVANIHAVKPDTVCIFVIPPSFDEWMMRMSGRGELPADEVRRRLTTALNEIATALNSDFYVFIVNDTFKHAARDIDAICQGTADSLDDTAAKGIARQLMADIKSFLAETI